MYKKKAFVLIEVLVYISISVVLVSISFNMMFGLVNCYNKTLAESKVITEEKVCCLNISRLLKRNKIKNVDVYNNRLAIDCINEDNIEELDIIEKINNKLFIKYYPKEGKGGSNVLMNDIEEFNLIKKHKVIYVTLIKGGISYKWCI